MNCIFSVNEHIAGKDLIALRKNNANFLNVLDTLSDTHIMDACAWLGLATAAVLRTDGNRTGSNVDGIRVAQLDFDNTWSVEKAMAHPMYADYCIGIYSTPSHGKVQGPVTDDKAGTMPPEQAAVLRERVGKPMVRFRMVFVLEDLLVAEQVSAFYAGLFTHFPMADDSCKDSARMFFGSPQAEIRHDNPSARRMGSCLVNELIQQGHGKSTSIRARICASAAQIGAHRTVSGKGSSQFAFSENAMIILANGTVTDCNWLVANLGTGYEHRVACISPFRHEKNPSAFVTKDEGGRLRIYDTAAKTAYLYFPATTPKGNQQGEKNA